MKHFSNTGDKILKHIGLFWAQKTLKISDDIEISVTLAIKAKAGCYD